jgi:hypothetical protein
MSIIIPVSCPNSKLLTSDWSLIIATIDRAPTIKGKIKRLLKLADEYGVINRGHSKGLPEPILFILQKRMTEVERIARYIIKNDPGMSHEFKEGLENIRQRFSGINATNVKRVF